MNLSIIFLTIATIGATALCAIAGVLAYQERPKPIP